MESKNYQKITNHGLDPKQRFSEKEEDNRSIEWRNRNINGLVCTERRDFKEQQDSSTHAKNRRLRNVLVHYNEWVGQNICT